MTLSQDQPTFSPAPSMSPLYEQLLKRPFPDTVSAINYCRKMCAEFGFTVKQEASANRNIYVYCSREGLPDSQRHPKTTPQRKRPSKRCDCRWRIVLSENDQQQWEFRKSMNPNASEHNHDMMSPDEMVKAWPVEVNDMIIYLAQQHLQTHEIRDAVKRRFPDISWNERRFYNRLTEERKRIRQRYTVDRTRRLLTLSAQLCALVASNEEWAQCVQGDMQRMVDNFTCLMGDGSPTSDLQMDWIQNIESPARASTNPPEESPSKKRKLPTVKGIQTVAVPSFHLFVRSARSPPQRSPESTTLSSPPPHMPSILPPNPTMHVITPNINNNAFLLASPTSSSSSSSRPFRIDMRYSPPPAAAQQPADDASFMLSPPPAPSLPPPQPSQPSYYPYPNPFMPDLMDIVSPPTTNAVHPSRLPATPVSTSTTSASTHPLPPRSLQEYPTDRYDPMLRVTDNAYY
ncbi:hypothetical protein DM01DRAFT_1407444 [Hesseltinella vesiculosa]|uniref:FAR1 domain-containing protein n=1 Tax=Hesseltinella vesiculosa TaxID=101127 RepID=A0A1X2GIY9_9FUNG|nr:hypothetical protein DM01DRAFT_1407444 [Hesseltinella vesiculosa]